MAFDFHLFQVKEPDADSFRKGFARIRFLDCREEGKQQEEIYDLRGSAFSKLQFLNWVRKEFGYLRYEVDFK